MFDEKFETNGNGKSNAKADGYSGKGMIVLLLFFSFKLFNKSRLII